LDVGILTAMLVGRNDVSVGVWSPITGSVQLLQIIARITAGANWSEWGWNITLLTKAIPLID